MTYKSLNSIKGIACIGVVLLHCTFPGETGKAISYIFKFAVPCFFMISGFFLFSPNKDKVGEHCIHRAIKNLRLLAFAFIFYGAINIMQNMLTGDFDIQTWLTSKFTIQEIPLKLFTGTFFNGTMWYLYALFWAYISIWVLNKRYEISRIYWLAILLLTLHITLRIFVKTQGYEWFRAEYFRNFWGFGIPFILIGYALAAFPQFVARTKDKWLLIMVLGGFLLQFAEYAIHRQPMDIVFGSVIFSIGLFSIALKHPERQYSYVINYIGERLSMPIYIGHMAVISILNLIDCRDSIVYQWLYPVIAVLACICTAWLWYKYNESRNLKRNE